ncbi:MAG: PilT/PilU family type 4a pilus ATPase [Polyangiales bacterium]
MALFGTSRSPLQRLVQQQWKSDDEKAQLLDSLREDAGVRAADVIPLLSMSDNTVRNAAATVFASRADAKAVTALLGEMPGQHAAARAFSVRVLGRVRPEVVGPGLEVLLKDASAMRKRLGWEVALELGGDARATFAERAIREAPGPIRVAALQRLAADRSPEQLAPLLMSLVADPEDRLRERVIELLAQLPPSEEVLDVMLDRFANDNATVRSHALTSVRAAAAAMPARVRPRLLKMLSEGDDSIRRTAVELLLSTGSPSEVIAEILHHCRTLLGWLRTRILNTLRTFGDEVLRPAVEMLGHPDDDIRMQALVLCEHFEDPRLVGPVVKLLDDEDWWLRITACETLAKLKDERVTPHLVKALDDKDTRWAAIDALGVIGGEQALRALVGLLNDDRQEVRMEVLQACARSTDPRLSKLFRKVVESDPSQDVRMRAAEILRAKGDTGAGLDAATSTVVSGDLSRPLDRLLADARERGASDVHLTVGEPPWFRLNGQLERVEHPPLDAKTTREWVLEILDPTRRASFEEHGEIDFCHAIPGVGRYRANAFVQRLGTCASFRSIPNLPPTFADLRIPGQLTQLLDYHQGIILVTGPAGGGKSTTLAAIINLVNESKSDHIIALEDPIEFVHPSKQSLVNQREVGRNTESFSRALRAALREDPDVIMVGEMRDIETIRMSLMAAETGHLVIATMHTTNCVATIDRLIESFPPDEQQQVRMGLSESLKFVVSQSLVPRADGKGRVAVFEVLKGSMNVSTLIRDCKTYQLPSLMQISRAQGMQTLDQSLADLLDAGLITAETAYMRAENKEQFEARLTGAAS